MVMNGVPMQDALTTQVRLEQRSKALAARLQVHQTAAAAIDPEAVPSAAGIATGLATEIALLLTWGTNPVNPVPA